MKTPLVIESLLTFDQLREQNVARCEEVFHKLNRWNHLEWAGAMCGEAGEHANLAKKLKRLDEADKEKDSPALRAKLAAAAVEELADVVIYADLCAARLGMSLGQAVVRKFNKVSRKRKSTRLL